MWHWLFCLSLAWAEIGFTVISKIPEVDGSVVRVKDGHLVASNNSDYPLLQVNSVNDTLVLSERIVASSALGAGIGVGKDLHLGVFSQPAHGFSIDSGNWLLFDGEFVFAVKQVASGDYVLYESWHGIGKEGTPVFIQAAKIVYPDGSSVPSSTESSHETSTRQGAATTVPVRQVQATNEPAPSAAHPTIYTTVFSTVYKPRTTLAEPVTSTISLFQDVIVVTTTETVTAWPTAIEGKGGNFDWVD